MQCDILPWFTDKSVVQSGYEKSPLIKEAHFPCAFMDYMRRPSSLFDGAFLNPTFLNVLLTCVYARYKWV